MGSILITSLFFFLLSLPMLHLHPGTQHRCDPVIHSHMPHAAGVHYHRNAIGRTIEDDDDGELEEIPVEISAVCPPAIAPAAPAVDFLALLPMDLAVKPDLESEFVAIPEPVAQPQPVFWSRFSPRSPPA
jgi:hypothetical protein